MAAREDIVEDGPRRPFVVYKRDDFQYIRAIWR